MERERERVRGRGRGSKSDVGEIWRKRKLEKAGEASRDMGT